MNRSSYHPSEQLRDIRLLMERSSRFIGLSGLAGISAGISALLGAMAVYLYLGTSPFTHQRFYYTLATETTQWAIDYRLFLLLDALLVLVLALSGGIYFTTRRARQKGQEVWNNLTKRVLINLAIPLVTGGVFCIALLYHGHAGWIAPATLLFYGLSLVNASKYTLEDLRYLGLSEIGLGLLASFFLGYGLEFWTIGFGFLHIFYGLRMYLRYEVESENSIA